MRLGSGESLSLLLLLAVGVSGQYSRSCATPFYLDEGSLAQGGDLISQDGLSWLTLQTDGNLVLYRGGTSVWASATSGVGSPAYRLDVQSDGNLVLYGDNGATATWASNSAGSGTGPYRLVIQNDGNLVLYDKDYLAIWSAATTYVTACGVLDCYGGHVDGCVCGYYKASANNCQACVAGKFKSSALREACSDCAAGTYSTGAAVNCSSCPSYSSSPPGSNEVSDCVCDPGSTGPNGQNCSECGAGAYKPSNGSAPCASCPSGKYNPHQAAASCIGCPAGSYVGLSGSSSLSNCTCNPGFSGPNGGPCLACEAGTYKPVRGSAACEKCPSSAEPASSNCSCVPGYTKPVSELFRSYGGTTALDNAIAFEVISLRMTDDGRSDFYRNLRDNCWVDDTYCWNRGTATAPARFCRGYSGTNETNLTSTCSATKPVTQVFLSHGATTAQNAATAYEGVPICISFDARDHSLSRDRDRRAVFLGWMDVRSLGYDVILYFQTPGFVGWTVMLSSTSRRRSLIPESIPPSEQGYH